MNPIKNTMKKGFARVPHGIIESPLPPNLRLLLCYCYSKPADWTFSVAEISRTLQFSNRTVQVYVKTLSQHGILMAAGQLKVKHGYIPIYTFCPNKVEVLMEKQPTQELTQQPAQELPQEPTQEPTQEKQTTKNNIPRMSTNIDGTKIENNNHFQTALKPVGTINPNYLSKPEIEELSRTLGFTVDQIKRIESDFL